MLYVNNIDKTINLYSVLDKMNLLPVFKALKIYDFPLIDPTSNGLSYWLVDKTCNFFPFLCKLVFAMVSDKDPSLLDISNMGYYLQHYPANTSIKSLEHFDQLIHLDAPIFRKFDYGEEGNRQRYGSESPPEYDMSKVSPV